MNTATRRAIEPRKSPVQARSAASVDAILEATIQVLRHEGREGVTTTKVARRAGVSVGSLYQYFPNKNSLLQATLRSHLKQLHVVLAAACVRYYGQDLDTIGEALVTVSLQAKFDRLETSMALYRISEDLDGAAIVAEVSSRSAVSIAALLGSSSERLSTEPEAAALMLMGVLAGASRCMLDAEDPHEARLTVEPELRVMVAAYLSARKIP